MEKQTKLHSLKLKRARLISDMEMLSEVNDIFYIQLGKTQAEIMKLEKEIVTNPEPHAN